MNDAAYQVVVAPSAGRAFKRLPEKIAAACVESIRGPLADNPHRIGKPLMGPLEGRYSARRGAYRVIYRIDDTTRQVQVSRIDHRADVHHV